MSVTSFNSFFSPVARLPVARNLGAVLVVSGPRSSPKRCACDCCLAHVFGSWSAEATAAPNTLISWQSLTQFGPCVVGRRSFAFWHGGRLSRLLSATPANIRRLLAPVLWNARFLCHIRLAPRFAPCLPVPCCTYGRVCFSFASESR